MNLRGICGRGAGRLFVMSRLFAATIQRVRFSAAKICDIFLGDRIKHSCITVAFPKNERHQSAPDALVHYSASETKMQCGGRDGEM